MKIISLMIAFTACLVNITCATSRSLSREMNVCYDLEAFLIVRLNYEKKGLPESWNDFEEVAMNLMGLSKTSPLRREAINSFALVPGAPVIKPHPKIPVKYSGNRLILISRIENVVNPSLRGRYAILVEPQESVSQVVKAHSYLIPEETAQVILKQIQNFDPKEQPFAFDDGVPNSPNRASKASSNSGNSPVPGGPESADETLNARVDQPSSEPKKPSDNLPLWILGIVMGILAVFCLFRWLSKDGRAKR